MTSALLQVPNCIKTSHDRDQMVAKSSLSLKTNLIGSVQAVTSLNYEDAPFPRDTFGARRLLCLGRCTAVERHASIELQEHL